MTYKLKTLFITSRISLLTTFGAHIPSTDLSESTSEQNSSIRSPSTESFDQLHLLKTGSFDDVISLIIERKTEVPNSIVKILTHPLNPNLTRDQKKVLEYVLPAFSGDSTPKDIRYAASMVSDYAKQLPATNPHKNQFTFIAAKLYQHAAEHKDSLPNGIRCAASGLRILAETHPAQKDFYASLAYYLYQHSRDHPAAKQSDIKWIAYGHKRLAELYHPGPPQKDIFANAAAEKYQEALRNPDTMPWDYISAAEAIQDLAAQYPVGSDQKDRLASIAASIYQQSKHHPKSTDLEISFASRGLRSIADQYPPNSSERAHYMTLANELLIKNSHQQ